jgi:predicted dehydrogenase
MPEGRNSRRDFLQTGSATLATAAAASTLSLATHVHAAGSDELKLGLVGCGGRGTGAANQALRADANTKLVAVADAFRDKADRSLENLKNQDGVADRVQVNEDHIFVGLDGYQAVIDSCDVVLLCTPPGFRPAHLAAAVEAGKHIFTEKPMATDSPGVRSVMESVAKSKEQNLAVLAGFCWRYHYAKQALFDKVLDGAIGDLRTVYGTYLTSPVKPMPPASKRPADMTDLQWMVRNWYNFAWISGDGLVEQACHTADWLAWAFGDTSPKSCTAVGGRQIPAEGGDIFDHVEINYVWDNGARGFLAQRQIPGCYNQNSLYLLGTKGNADLTRGSTIRDLNDKVVWKYDGPSNDMYQTEHDVFFKSIRSGNHLNDGDRMVNSTLLAIMGRTAGYTGQQLTWEDALTSEEALVPDLSAGWDSPVTFRDVPRPGIS